MRPKDATKKEKRDVEHIVDRLELMASLQKNIHELNQLWKKGFEPKQKDLILSAMYKLVQAQSDLRKTLFDEKVTPVVEWPSWTPAPKSGGPPAWPVGKPESGEKPGSREKRSSLHPDTFKYSYMFKINDTIKSLQEGISFLNPDAQVEAQNVLNQLKNLHETIRRTLLQPNHLVNKRDVDYVDPWDRSPLDQALDSILQKTVGNAAVKVFEGLVKLGTKIDEVKKAVDDKKKQAMDEYVKFVDKTVEPLMNKVNQELNKRSKRATISVPPTKSPMAESWDKFMDKTVGTAAFKVWEAIKKLQSKMDEFEEKRAWPVNGFTLMENKITHHADQ